jgi:hypothetical protein
MLGRFRSKDFYRGTVYRALVGCLLDIDSVMSVQDDVSTFRQEAAVQKEDDEKLSRRPNSD